ncbi:MAG TPA: peptide chain release factor N(5)-glutamine methyltransferase [Vicinamibacterales bacterium]
MDNTLQQAIVRARERLVRAGITERDADLDARLLARHVLGWDAARLLVALREPPPALFPAAYEDVIARREWREPVAYITGTREFWGLPFDVTPDVLVPRPETELLVEMAVEILARSPKPVAWSPLVIDVATGSGCIAIAVAHSCPEVHVIATDCSAAALGVAQRNAVQLGVADRIRFLETDLLAGVQGQVDLVVSNPPYVPDEDAASLAPEVRDFEPHTALFGGTDGLAIIERLLPQALDRIRPGGYLLFECGEGQASAIEELISREPACTIIDIRPDLQGIPRAVLVQVAEGHS